METVQFDWLVVVYMLSAMLYGMFARTSIWQNERAAENRLLFAIFLLLSLWTTAFAFAAPAPTLSLHLFFRQAAAIGWGTVFSFILHFVLLITGREAFARRLWARLALYVPAVVNLYAFLISPFAGEQFNLVQTSRGWVSYYVTSFWNTFHTVYFISFSALSILLVVLWYLRSKDAKQRQESGLLVGSFLAAFVLGALGDFILHMRGYDKIPQLGAVYILIPSAVALYCMRRFHAVEHDRPSAVRRTVEILSDASRDRVYRVAGIALAVLSYINSYFIVLLRRDYNTEAFLLQGGLVSILLLAGGEIIFWMNRMSRSRKVQERTITVIVVMLDILMMQRNYARGFVSVWAGVILFIMVGIVFSDAKLVLFVAGAHAAMEVLIVLFRPETLHVAVGPTDFLLRGTLVIVGTVLAFLINRTYISRMRVNLAEQAFQVAVADLSSTLTAEGEAEHVMNKGMAIMQEYLAAHCVAIVRFGDREELSGQLCLMPGEQAVTRPLDAATAAAISQMLKSMPSPPCNEPQTIKVTELQLSAPDAYQHFFDQGIAHIVMTKFEAGSFDARSLLLVFFDAGHPGAPEDRHLDSFIRLASVGFSNYLIGLHAQQELNYLAHFDPMTNLYHRTSFIERATAVVAEEAHKDRLVAVLFMDIDMFKEFNDTMGHAAGDRILVTIAQRLQSVFDGNDLLGRFGGDEFLILHTAGGREQLQEKVDELLAIMREPVHLPQACLYLTISLGIALYPQDGQTVDVLLNNADFSMYEAKKRGKNQYAYYADNERALASYVLEMKDGLRKAMERDELLVYYQPQVRLTDGQCTGLKAIAYWRDSRHDRILPIVYASLAEERDMVAELERWVIRMACEQVGAWQSIGIQVGRLSANCSIHTLTSRDAESPLLELIGQTGISLDTVELDIPESEAASLAPEMLARMTSMRHAGLRFSIDGFGAQHSTLAQLNALPIERIKLDRALIDLAILQADKGSAILSNLIHMAHEVGIRSLALSVSREVQHRLLLQWGCEEGQGPLFMKAVSAGELESRLLTSRQGLVLPDHPGEKPSKKHLPAGPAAPQSPEGGMRHV